MQHNREAGQAAFHLSQNVKTQLGLGARLKFVGSVAGADGNGQGIHTGAAHKFFHLRWVGVGAVRFAHIHVIFHAGQAAQFALHRHAVLVGVIHHLLGQGDVVLKAVFGAVNHH